MTTVARAQGRHFALFRSNVFQQLQLVTRQINKCDADIGIAYTRNALKDAVGVENRLRYRKTQDIPEKMHGALHIGRRNTGMRHPQNLTSVHPLLPTSVSMTHTASPT